MAYRTSNFAALPAQKKTDPLPQVVDSLTCIFWFYCFCCDFLLPLVVHRELLLLWLSAALGHTSWAAFVVIFCCPWLYIVSCFCCGFLLPLVIHRELLLLWFSAAPGYTSFAPSRKHTKNLFVVLMLVKQLALCSFMIYKLAINSSATSWNSILIKYSSFHTCEYFWSLPNVTSSSWWCRWARYKGSSVMAT